MNLKSTVVLSVALIAVSLIWANRPTAQMPTQHVYQAVSTGNPNSIWVVNSVTGAAWSCKAAGGYNREAGCDTAGQPGAN